VTGELQHLLTQSEEHCVLVTEKEQANGNRVMGFEIEQIEPEQNIPLETGRGPGRIVRKESTQKQTSSVMKLTRDKLRLVIQEEIQGLNEDMDMDYMVDGRTYKMMHTEQFHAGYVQPSSSGNVLQKALTKMGIRGVPKSSIERGIYFSSSGEWRLRLNEVPSYYIHEDGEVVAMSEIKKAKVNYLEGKFRVQVVPSKRPGNDVESHPQFVADYIEANR